MPRGNRALNESRACSCQVAGLKAPIDRSKYKQNLCTIDKSYNKRLYLNCYLNLTSKVAKSAIGPGPPPDFSFKILPKGFK